MYIMPVSACSGNFNQQTILSKTGNGKNLLLKNPSFKDGGVGAYAFLTALRSSAGVVKGYNRAGKILKYKKEALNIINHAEENKDKIHSFVVELSRASKNFDSYSSYTTWLLWRKDTIPMADIRQQVLTKVFPFLDDSNYSQQEAKKSYMTSLYNGGEYKTPEFFETFKNLPKQYIDFKRSLVSKILYAREVLAKSYTHQSDFVFNINLASTMLSGEAPAIEHKINNGIDLNKKFLFESLLNGYKKYSDSAFVRYSKDFNDGKDELSSVTPYEKMLFNQQLINSKFDTKTLANNLNISHIALAESIIEDFKALTIADNLNEQSRKIEFLDKYITKKFQQEFIVDGYDENSSLINIKINNIKSFINRTGDLKEILKDRFKISMDFLEKDYKNAVRYENSASERDHDEYLEKINHVMLET